MWPLIPLPSVYMCKASGSLLVLYWCLACAFSTLSSMNVSGPVHHGGTTCGVIASIFSRSNPPSSRMAFCIALRGLVFVLSSLA
ncbi:hypothetical protein EDB80DRAFT_740822 [Ilyonectria destructans]|nr:hypothetical protein EDB80DRAFT_740822 [Ilyonectria destructans]